MESETQTIEWHQQLEKNSIKLRAFATQEIDEQKETGAIDPIRLTIDEIMQYLSSRFSDVSVYETETDMHLLYYQKELICQIDHEYYVLYNFLPNSLKEVISEQTQLVDYQREIERQVNYLLMCREKTWKYGKTKLQKIYILVRLRHFRKIIKEEQKTCDKELLSISRKIANLQLQKEWIRQDNATFYQIQTSVTNWVRQKYHYQIEWEE